MRRLTALLLSAALLCALLLPASASGPSDWTAAEALSLSALVAEEGGPSDWADAEVQRAVELGFVPGDLQGDWQRPITRAEFARLALFFLAVQHGYLTSYEALNGTGTLWDISGFLEDYRENRPDRDGADYDAAAYVTENSANFCGWAQWAAEIFSDLTEESEPLYVNAAYTFGLVNGRGEGRFDPAGSITRQEAAAMLARTYAAYGGDAGSADGADGAIASFADDADIAGWARGDVALVSAELGIMEGDGGRFNPLGLYTREQCVVTFLRLYEKAPVSRQLKNVPRLTAFEADVQEFYDMWDFYLWQRFDTEEATLLYANHGGHMHAYSALHVIYRAGGTRTIECSPRLCGLSADQRTLFCVDYDAERDDYAGGALDIATLRPDPPPSRAEIAAMIKGQEGFTAVEECSNDRYTVIYGTAEENPHGRDGGQLWAVTEDGRVMLSWPGLPAVDENGMMTGLGQLPPLRNLQFGPDGETLGFEAAYGGGTVWYSYTADLNTRAVTLAQ